LTKYGFSSACTSNFDIIGLPCDHDCRPAFNHTSWNIPQDILVVERKRETKAEEEERL
jgi:hypothetical protein